MRGRGGSSARVVGIGGGNVAISAATTRAFGLASTSPDGARAGRIPAHHYTSGYTTGVRAVRTFAVHSPSMKGWATAQQIQQRTVPNDPMPARGTDRAFLRWVGYSGVLASLAFLTTVVVANVSAVAEPGGPDEIAGYLEEVAQAAWSSYIYGLAGIALVVLYVPMAVGVHRLLGRTPTAWFGSGAVIAGLAALFPAYVSSIVLPFGPMSAAADIGVGGADALYVTYAYAGAAATVLFAVGSVLSLGFGPLLWGVAWLRVRASRRWLGWAAVVTGVTGMVWFVPGVASPALIIVLLCNVLVSLVCFTGFSLVLAAEGRAVTPGGTT